MPTALYDGVFSAPRAQAPAKKRLNAAQEELEFSEYGRSPRFGPGWYIVPLLLAWPVLVLVWLI
jgi:hypothetical protein